MIDEKIFKETEKMMKNTEEALKRDLVSLRTGTASMALLDEVMVDYYGSKLPLNQVASISIPEPRLIVIQPWDKRSLGDIERAIYKSDLGMSPVNDGNLIRLSVPELTEERRKELVKIVAKKAEEGKIAVRNVRRDSNEKIKALQKNKEISEDESRAGQERIQKLTDRYIEEIDRLSKSKEEELLKI